MPILTLVGDELKLIDINGRASLDSRNELISLEIERQYSAAAATAHWRLADCAQVRNLNAVNKAANKNSPRARDSEQRQTEQANEQEAR